MTSGVYAKRLSKLPDEDLIRNIKEYDCKVSLDALILKHLSLIKTLVMKAEKDRQLQDDALQDCILKLVAGVKSFRGDSQFSTWLYRVVLNALSGHIKSEIRKPDTVSVYNSIKIEDGSDVEYIETLIDYDGMDHEPDVLKEMESVNKRVIEIINTCGDKRYREVLSLHFIQNMTDEDAAEQLGIPVGTVKSRLHFSRKWLKNRMIREGILEQK